LAHPAHKLFDTVTVHRKSDGPPRSYADYEVKIDELAIEKLKGKIELLDLI